MYRYRVYELNIQSEIPLPELGSGTGPNGVADVRVRQGRIDFSGQLRLEQQEAIFQQEGVGIFQVLQGREIVVAPAPDAKPESVRLFLLGQAMDLLLTQRGCLTLHASAVRRGGEALAFAAGKGWGKSTLAAALSLRGYPLITDDLLALQVEAAAVTVLPGSPHCKLWPESLRAMGVDPQKLPRLHPSFEKRSQRMAATSLSESCPLGRIFILAEGDPELRMEDLSPASALLELTRHSYGIRRKHRLYAPSNFHKCKELVSRIPVQRLRLPRSLEHLKRALDQLEEQMESHTSGLASGGRRDALARDS